MKKAFTLVELLVVVVILVTLMSIVFRLGGIGSDQTRRNTTIVRMQRLENCLSGYYAAFGTYPPVDLHGSRNFYLTANSHGIQTETENKSIWGWKAIGETKEQEAWQQVRAACKAQPVDCRFPFPAEPAYNEVVKAVSDTLAKKAASLSEDDPRRQVLMAGFDNGVTDNIGRFNQNSGEKDWRSIQLFRFGLMSYLLPRYLVMMNSEEKLYSDAYAQWWDNNEIPCNPMTGFEFNDWGVVRDRSRSNQFDEKAEVANIPSQAVSARWMPNLEGIVCCNHNYCLYGISIRGDIGASELNGENLNIEVFSPGNAEGDSTSQQYVLDSATVLDGWWNEFYYYSAPPHQTYTLWSAGPNGRTFPPWVSRKTLDAEANRCIALWIEDDIVRMSH